MNKWTAGPPGKATWGIPEETPKQPPKGASDKPEKPPEAHYDNSLDSDADYISIANSFTHMVTHLRSSLAQDSPSLLTLI